MASITIKYDPNLVDDPTLSDIGWLWTLRIYASGKIPLNFESSWPVHLLPLIEKYATNNQGKESIEFKYEFLANELDRLGSAKTINDSHLAQNLRMVADSFTLSDIERQILEFRTIYRVHNGLEQTVDLISNRWTDNLVHQIIGHALAVPTTIIADALRPESKLIKSGLLIMHSSIKSDFGRKLIALDGFVNGVQSFREKTLDIFGFLFNKATGATLALNNFAHQKDDIDIIIKYLEQCHKHKRVGVNILLHGVPGVGKTELARLISQELEITAYEVSSSDFDSDDQNDQPPSRFKSYLILQNLISQMDSGLIIFDEIEDVLPRLGLLDRPSNGHKAWINNLLETNQSPSIWISNHVNHGLHG
ncbi:ATP-binding protein [Methylophilus sp.]|uniref:ATP-binding protein n=1 Tax=Methylophilus sp. TaxID=29541 RepID=UPI0011D6C1DA|nr:ATP-binding protein [Methylophilus sp.]TXI44166.1 MAG: ATP-binding protein [Methylophilus sp.]